MKFLINNSNDPFYNLAFEEYIFKNYRIDNEEDYFFLWQNSPVVVIGKNQNTSQEINSDFIEENNIKVVRRNTGGGAVYHDLGNVNFTFIVKLEKDLASVNFKKYTEPMVKSLKKLGINAVMSGRNDILVDEKKVSGNSQRQEKSYLLHHGTLLFDVNIENMVRSLSVSDEKFISKAVKSVRSRVTNLKNYLPNLYTVEEFKKAIHNELAQGDTELFLTDSDKKSIEKLKREKYDTWDWNYGKSPEFSFHNKKRFDSGTIETYVDVKEGIIRNIRFIGDYIGLKDIDVLEEEFKGTKYIKKDIDNVLSKFILSEYFGTITKDEIANLIFENN